jgi:hypothetical protein
MPLDPLVVVPSSYGFWAFVHFSCMNDTVLGGQACQRVLDTGQGSSAPQGICPSSLRPPVW